ncbi:hypothetical protein G0Q06_11430 [Puniceicoccales bacterium CK1056]|uniref:Uncharacterized protein n=1 Tax=Oceanipulchritudo coccoides TaxID=2706888 RepID=A0A6B2M3R9_9BACT|nr:hypothetical protein [Oceanipulchritudo coccoides]NDV63066.1 hypothetical protein [Oceanipulchritudo coccoides]
MKGLLSYAGLALNILIRFLLLTAAITLAGALCGAVLFVLVGMLWNMDFTLGELIRNGLFDGGFLALIWAPGISFVALVVQAHKRKENSGA